MRIDLHTHSSRSDGTDSPAVLVAKAAAAGLDVVALTDHDTTVGWAEAEVAAEAAGVRLVKGIELSTSNEGQGLHLLAYEPDPEHSGLAAMLAAGTASRDGRTGAMLAKIQAAGYDISPEAVARFAGDGSAGRPHIADALVEAGVVADRDEAFVRFLKRGGIAYVHRYQPTVDEAIATVAAAGGVAVVAHPWGRNQFVSEERFAQLQAVGLVGIEVDHQEHDDGAREVLRAIAANLGLLVTGASDHHGAGKTDHDLGCNLTDPDEFAALLELAAAGRAGRARA